MYFYQRNFDQWANLYSRGLIADNQLALFIQWQKLKTTTPNMAGMIVQHIGSITNYAAF